MKENYGGHMKLETVSAIRDDPFQEKNRNCTKLLSVK